MTQYTASHGSRYNLPEKTWNSNLCMGCPRPGQVSPPPEIAFPSFHEERRRREIILTGEIWPGSSGSSLSLSLYILQHQRIPSLSNDNWWSDSVFRGKLQGTDNFLSENFKINHQTSQLVLILKGVVTSLEKYGNFWQKNQPWHMDRLSIKLCFRWGF